MNVNNLHLIFATRKKGINYLRINNLESAVDSLKRAEEHIEKVEDNIFHWKWTIICLQNSLYVFALTVAAGSNSDSVKKKNGDVISFIEAVKRCIGLKYFVHSTPLQLSHEQKNSILWLHEHFRNNFEHFQPKSWSISLRGIPNLCINVLEVIKFLAIDGDHITYHTKSKKNKVISSINRSFKLLKKSKFYDPKIQLKVHSKLNKYFP
jgi:hypothetical protein